MCIWIQEKQAVVNIVKRVIEYRHKVSAKDFVDQPLQPEIAKLMGESVSASSISSPFRLMNTLGTVIYV